MSDRTRLGLADGADLLGLGLDELWWRYAGLGGALGLRAFAELVGGRPSGPRVEVDIAAHAMNEAFLDLDLPTFPVGYRTTNPGPSVRRGRSDDLVRRRVDAVRRSRQLQGRSMALTSTSTRLLFAAWRSSGVRAGSPTPAGAVVRRTVATTEPPRLAAQPDRFGDESRV